MKRNKEAANRLNTFVTAVMAVSDPNYGLTSEQIKNKAKKQEIEMRKRLIKKEEEKKRKFKGIDNNWRLVFKHCSNFIP